MGAERPERPGADAPEGDFMKWRQILLFVAGLAVSYWASTSRTFPPGANLLFDVEYTLAILEIKNPWIFLVIEPGTALSVRPS